ncbi:myozenin-2 [Alosa sapidissima]|uniref:myozenin-2 n=1 Tax=Alosa sapidissima TaxID=34773 RepID=UPI001C0994AC|nr:myozenin-2 [Alosa sapidissima]
MMMMMMHGVPDDWAKQRQQQAMALSREVRGERLNLGKKISTPKDVQMEELHLNSNRGSRMFQERLKRVEKFTLENTVNSNPFTYDQPEMTPAENQTQNPPEMGKENLTYIIPGKTSLVNTLKMTVAKKGCPNVLAPGYSGPLREIPTEKFNATVIPKSYCSPWREALGSTDNLVASLSSQLPEPPQKLPPSNYRCFNRAAMPFGGQMASKRVIPVINFEQVDSQNLPGSVLERMASRPNFNRAPRGWGMDYTPESSDL